MRIFTTLAQRMHLKFKSFASTLSLCVIIKAKIVNDFIGLNVMHYKNFNIKMFSGIDG